MPRNVTLSILLALIVAHIVLAANYAAVTPYRQAGVVLGWGRPQQVVDIGAPDERQHVNYVIHLLKTHSFPVFNPNDKNLGETYQSHQPPAYYLLAAAWSTITGASDLEQRDSGLKLRALNIVLGAGTVAGVFFLAFWGFRNPEVALTAAAFTALLPMFTALSGAVSNDPLLILLCTWVLAVTALCLRDGWSWKRVIAIGVLTGLAMLTKTTALALVPILLLAAFLPQEVPKPEYNPEESTLEALGALDSAPKRKPAFAMLCVAGVLALVIVGPWWARNQSLYKDPLAINAFNQAFKGSPQKSALVEGFQASDPDSSAEMTYWKDWVGWWTARSFFGVFGNMDIWLNETGTSFTGTSQKGVVAPNTLYRICLAMVVLCVIGWIWAMTKGEWKATKSVQILNAAFAVIVLLLFLKFNMQYFQAQARYLFPALGPISCAVAIGVWQMLGTRRVLALPVVAILLLGLNLYALSVVPDGFAKRVDALKQMG